MLHLLAGVVCCLLYCCVAFAGLFTMGVDLVVACVWFGCLFLCYVAGRVLGVVDVVVAYCVIGW